MTTTAGRLFTIFWTFMGQILLILFVSFITESLTIYTVSTTDRSLYGKQVNSAAFSISHINNVCLAIVL